MPESPRDFHHPLLAFLSTRLETHVLTYVGMCTVFLGCRVVHTEQASSVLVLQPANDFAKRGHKPEVPPVSRVLLLGKDQTLNVSMAYTVYRKTSFASVTAEIQWLRTTVAADRPFPQRAFAPRLRDRQLDRRMTANGVLLALAVRETLPVAYALAVIVAVLALQLFATTRHGLESA